MADAADVVGWIVELHDDGYYLYGCAECAPPEIRAQTHRQVLRDEAEEIGATCDECGDELEDAPA